MYVCASLPSAGQPCAEWVVQSSAGLLPPLSLADAGEILGAVALVFAAAFAVRVIKRL